MVEAQNGLPVDDDNFELATVAFSVMTTAEQHKTLARFARLMGDAEALPPVDMAFITAVLTTIKGRYAHNKHP